uniref:Ubiquinone biosynthesis protein n=1 Tax=Chromera velia CCMP2878 TaxID=1169474 RepID=A0A0G4G124_9ALVE|eukprot:Cvel_19724.t1-p1 / transcript=Cvel_19724.t1 / gene=Cvel_19724 / organism=Chromera_velia_CCMP2878 / gene_product=hypothetical protein / transcript_product=hypothetical protein / location=Cvel_scaffold1724:6659-12326(-) / protein_length=591 / sequence_SO=supercontig / SO=protein_coding / is_pseudo=false
MQSARRFHTRAVLQPLLGRAAPLERLPTVSSGTRATVRLGIHCNFWHSRATSSVRSFSTTATGDGKNGKTRAKAQEDKGAAGWVSGTEKEKPFRKPKMVDITPEILMEEALLKFVPSLGFSREALNAAAQSLTDAPSFGSLVSPTDLLVFCIDRTTATLQREATEIVTPEMTSFEERAEAVVKRRVQLLTPLYSQWDQALALAASPDAALRISQTLWRASGEICSIAGDDSLTVTGLGRRTVVFSLSLTADLVAVSVSGGGGDGGKTKEEVDTEREKAATEFVERRARDGIFLRNSTEAGASAALSLLTAFPSIALPTSGSPPSLFPLPLTSNTMPSPPSTAQLVEELQKAAQFVATSPQDLQAAVRGLQDRAADLHRKVTAESGREAEGESEGRKAKGEGDPMAALRLFSEEALETGRRIGEQLPKPPLPPIPNKPAGGSPFGLPSPPLDLAPLLSALATPSAPVEFQPSGGRTSSSPDGQMGGETEVKTGDGPTVTGAESSEKPSSPSATGEETGTPRRPPSSSAKMTSESPPSELASGSARNVQWTGYRDTTFQFENDHTDTVRKGTDKGEKSAGGAQKTTGTGLAPP